MITREHTQPSTRPVEIGTTIANIGKTDRRPKDEGSCHRRPHLAGKLIVSLDLVAFINPLIGLTQCLDQDIAERSTMTMPLLDVGKNSINDRGDAKARSHLTLR